MRWFNLLIYGLISAGVVTIAFANPRTILNAQLSPEPSVPLEEERETQQLKRHKITVTLTSPEDLKVKEKQRIQAGEILSDRTSERQRLEVKKKQLEISIAQMSLPLSEIAKLPEPNLETEGIVLKKAKFELERATRILNGYQGLQFRNKDLSEVMEPEKVKELAVLREQQITASINVEAALARLSEAKTQYQQQQYQHSIQLAAHQTKLQRQQYDLASLINQLQEIEEKLEEIVEVRSPYSGRVRKIKILGQNDRIITAQVTLDVR